jgi:circadian clock protein KaiC
MGEQIPRIPTGILGLDDMLEGGFPFPSTILLAGPAGSGKTIFSLQFLCEGVRQKEKCIYFSTMSEPTQWMLRFLREFDFVDKRWFGKEIEYVDLGPSLTDGIDPLKLLYMIEEKVTEAMPQRIVIDPVTVIRSVMDLDYRTFLFNLSTRLKNWNTVSLLTGEVGPNEAYPTEVSYIVDGLVLLSNFKLGVSSERKRYLEVLKMRGTNHLTGDHLFDITYKGIMVQPGLK